MTGAAFDFQAPAAPDTLTRCCPQCGEPAEYPDCTNCGYLFDAKQAPDDILSHELRFSRIDGVGDTNPRPWPVTWADFLGAIAEPVIHGDVPLDEFLALDKTQRSAIKKPLPAFIPATFQRDGIRKKEAVLAVHALVLDIDGGIDRAGIETSLDGMTYAAYTSFSNAPNAERWRVILPLAGALPPSKQGELFTQVKARFPAGVDIDPCSKNPACLYFLPAAPPGGEPYYRHFSKLGELLTLAAVPAAAAPVDAPPAVTVGSAFQPVDLVTLPIKPAIRALIRDGVDKGDRSESLWRCLCELVTAGCTDAVILSVLTDPTNGISNKPLCERGGNRHSAAEWLSGQIAKARAELAAVAPPPRGGGESGDLTAQVQAIAETAPDEITADTELRALAETSGVTFSVLRAQYRDARKAVKQQRASEEKARAEQARYDEQRREFEAQAMGPDEVLAELNRKHAVLQYANRVLILSQTRDPVMNRDTLAFMSAADFRLKYGNRFVLIPGESQFQSTPWAEFWLKHPGRREYDGIVFTPGESPKGYFNLWRGLAVDPVPGNCSRLLEHILNVICSGDDEKYTYLLKWCAHLVQKTAELPEVAVVMRSKQGTGKNTFIDALGAIFGRHYVPLNQNGLLCGRFTAHLMDAVLVFANEAVWGGDKAGEGRLKAMITDPVETIEAKGKDAISVPNFKRIIAASNETWAVPRGIDDRRFFCLDVSPHRIGDTDYFTALHQEIQNGGIAAFLHELLSVDLTGWHPRHSMPASNTDGEDIKLEGMSTALRFWHYCLQYGRNTPPDPDYPDAPKWRNQVECERFYLFYLEWCNDQRITHRMNPNHFGVELRKAIDLGKARLRNGHNRITVYEFPDLDTARGEFQRRIARIKFE